MANYPSDPDVGYRRPRGSSSTPSANRWLPPLDERSAREHPSAPPPPAAGAGQKVTVTRAAAQRSREMGSKMYGLVHRAATADGADKSGLTALTWPVVANFAVDAAMAVALANTLFFAAASGESKGKVALYLLITIAPFAVIAPLIGPALDRLQHGRRVALATSFILRTAVGGGADRQLRRRDRQLSVLGAVSVRAGNDGAVQVIQRAAQRGHSACAAAHDRPGAGELAADDLRTARRNDGRRRDRRRRRVLVRGVPSARRVVRHRRCDAGRRGAVDANPEVGRGDGGRGPRHAVATTVAAGSCAATPNSTRLRAIRDNRWAATSLLRCGATARSR